MIDNKTTQTKWMQKAIELAKKGLGFVHPYPLVGAVLVKNGKKIGEGWYRFNGSRHAEVEAIFDARKKGHDVKGSTLFVNLEPCCTNGRTPPCTSEILSAGISHVVVGSTDPNPHHHGKAFELLRKHGITVNHGVLKKECDAINRPFFYWISTGMPWIIAKVACTQDGYIKLPAKRKWISSPASRRHAHQLRAQCGAILIGAETLRQDNPHLTVRGFPVWQQPWRVVVTQKDNLPKNAHLFTDDYRDKTLIYRRQPWQKVFEDLGKKGVNCVMIEGGANVLQQLVEASWIDELYLYQSPLSLHEKSSNMPNVNFLKQLPLEKKKQIKLGPDTLIHGIVKKQLL